MTKKILIALGIVVIVAIALWLVFFSQSSVPLTDSLGGGSPFGSGGDATGPGFTTEEENSEKVEDAIFDENGKPATALFRLSHAPVAGATAFTRSTSTTIVRYVDRATGHIYEVNPATLIEKKISNQTLPKIYEAYFRPDGQAVLLRSLKNDSDTIENLTLTLTPPTGTSTDGLYKVAATNLRGDIDSVSVGAGNTLFYSLNDSGSIVSSTFNNPALRTLLTSAFKGWELAANGTALVAYTKASSQASGFAYSINTSSGALTKLLGPLNGLTVVPDAQGARLVYSYIDRGRVKSETKNLQNQSVVPISPVTFAEKCVWSVKNKGVLYCGSPMSDLAPSNIDAWYQGKINFSDMLWRFDVNSEIADVVFEPKATLDIDIDAVDLKLSPLEDYLIFINKRDLSLWALKLEKV